jgi:inosine/xanthosine triphosphate pyrophosphatase family protein
MKKEILLATNNQGKIERYKKIAKHIDPKIVLHTLNDVDIERIDVEEDGTLEENAKKKAMSYFRKTNLPVLANDAGFFVKNIGLVKNPKRIALNFAENSFTKEEIYDLVINYWKDIATKNGGEIDAAWVDAFAVCMPDGNLYEEDARREVILTNQIFGEPHIQFPIRALYISKATNKPAANHTEEDELIEIQPIYNALEKLFKVVINYKNGGK